MFIKDLFYLHEHAQNQHLGRICSAPALLRNPLHRLHHLNVEMVVGVRSVQRQDRTVLHRHHPLFRRDVL